MIELILVILIIALARVPIIDLILVILVVTLGIVAMRLHERLRDWERFDADYRAKLLGFDAQYRTDVMRAYEQARAEGTRATSSA
jgi:hypothetical protein